MSNLDFMCPACRDRLNGEGRRICSGCGFRLELSQGVWRNEALHQPRGFGERQVDHLRGIEHRHFWFAPRDRLLASLVAKHFQVDGTVLEIGCGSGRLLPTWASSHKAVVAVDANRAMLDAVADTANGMTLVQADTCALPFFDEMFDAIFSFDVIEHVDDRRMLEEAHRVARRGGFLLLAAPAFMSLWSAADELAGHNRRYDLETMEQLMHETNWQLLGHTYYQCFLFPLLWLSRKVVGNRGRALERYPSSRLSNFLRRINMLEVKLTSHLPAPFGSSLIIWAKSI